MKEVEGNLWEYPADVRCITTNGIVTRSGKAIMGAGCAREAVEKYPWIAERLGTMLRYYGNHVYSFNQATLFTFPTIEDKLGQSQLGLIEQSAYELLDQIDAQYPNNPNLTVLIPRPGAGIGGLKYEEEVRPKLEEAFGDDDRFVIITFEGGGKFAPRPKGDFVPWWEKQREATREEGFLAR